MNSYGIHKMSLFLIEEKGNIFAKGYVKLRIPHFKVCIGP